MRFVPQSNGAAADTALLGGHIDIKLGGGASDGVELGDKVRVLANRGAEATGISAGCADARRGRARSTGSRRCRISARRAMWRCMPSLKTKHPDRYKVIVDSYKAAFHSAGYQEALKKTGQDARRNS